MLTEVKRNKTPMRFILGVIIVLSGLWVGYWWLTATGLEQATRLWLNDRAREGWQAEADVSVAGFPYRFDMSWENLSLADPDTGVAWAAPLFQILALSYNPNHIIAIWPDEQTVASPYERVSVTSDDMRGSVVFEPGTRLEVDRANIVVDSMQLTSDQGWISTLDSARFALRRVENIKNGYDLGFDAVNLAPAEYILRTLDPLSTLPSTIQTMRIDAAMTFDAPWDRFAIEDGRPGITGLDLRELKAIWGDLDLRLAGELEIDSAGIPSGRIVVKAKNWKEMLELGVNSGSIPRDFAPTLERALEVLAGLSGNPNTLDAPLTFQNGSVKFGPISLGSAPRFILR